MSALALKDRKIGDKVRVACRERTHSIPSQGGRNSGWKQLGQKRSTRQTQGRGHVIKKKKKKKKHKKKERQSRHLKQFTPLTREPGLKPSKQIKFPPPLQLP